MYDKRKNMTSNNFEQMCNDHLFSLTTYLKSALALLLQGTGQQWTLFIRTVSNPVITSDFG